MQPHPHIRLQPSFGASAKDRPQQVYLIVSPDPARKRNMSFAWVKGENNQLTKVVFTDVIRSKRDRTEKLPGAWVVWAGRERDFFMTTGLKPVFAPAPPPPGPLN